eukprot:c29018_g1_i3 orf=288-2195(+)
MMSSSGGDDLILKDAQAESENGQDNISPTKDQDRPSMSGDTLSRKLKREENSTSFHTVDIPSPTNVFRTLSNKFREILCKRDSISGFQGHNSKSRKFLLWIQHTFPIFEWAPKYRIVHFKADAIAGLTIASLAIPQGISYAKLAGLPPILGLYSSFVPPLIYAVMGTSKDLAVGTVSVVSLLLRSLLSKEASNSLLHLQLAITATFFAGIFQASLGFFRLGLLLDFLSHATIVGFMAGAAIMICLQQLKGLLGIQHFTAKTDLFSVMHSVRAARDEWNWHTAVLGACFLSWLLVARHISGRKKELYWVAALAPLVSVIISTLSVYLTRADKHGVSIVGHLHKGLNPPSTEMIFLHGQYALKSMKIGMITAVIALTEAMAVGRTFASLKDYQIDANREMIAIGMMNISGACTSCYITTGSLSRSAISYNAGGKTAVTNVVMAIVMAITLLFLTPLFEFTPSAVLSAVLISAVINLIDFHAMRVIWKVDKLDFLAMAGALFGVVLISVEVGLLVAVAISMMKILLHVTRPRIAILGNIPGTSIYRNVKQYPEACRMQGVMIIRIDAAIYFSNSNYILGRYVHLARYQMCRILARQRSLFNTAREAGIGHINPVSETKQNATNNANFDVKSATLYCNL